MRCVPKPSPTQDHETEVRVCDWDQLELCDDRGLHLHAGVPFIRYDEWCTIGESGSIQLKLRIINEGTVSPIDIKDTVGGRSVFSF